MFKRIKSTSRYLQDDIYIYIYLVFLNWTVRYKRIQLPTTFKMFHKSLSKSCSERPQELRQESNWLFIARSSTMQFARNSSPSVDRIKLCNWVSPNTDVAPLPASFAFSQKLSMAPLRPVAAVEPSSAEDAQLRRWTEWHNHECFISIKPSLFSDSPQSTVFMIVFPSLSSHDIFTVAFPKVTLELDPF